MRDAPVSSSVRVTVTPGMTPPSGSWMSPWIRPSKVCAPAPPAVKRKPASIRAADERLVFMVESSNGWDSVARPGLRR